MNEADSENKKHLFSKAKKLPLVTRIILTIALSIIWIMVISYIGFGLQLNWIISTFVIAWIFSVFFPFSKK